MIESTRCIERMLEMRFGKMEAQALKFGRARIARMDLQFTDIKRIADLCAVTGTGRGCRFWPTVCGGPRRTWPLIR